jgi:hypothetical protein
MEAICDISLKTWLTEEEACIYTGYGRDILREAREKANLTFYKKKGAIRSSIRYKRPDLDKFMELEHEECKAYSEITFKNRRSCTPTKTNKATSPSWT